MTESEQSVETVYRCKDCGIMHTSITKIFHHVNTHYPLINWPWKSYPAHSSKIEELKAENLHKVEDLRDGE